MMLFVTGESGAGELCAVVRGDARVVRFRARLTGGSYRAVTRQFPAAHGSSARFTT